MIGDHKVHTTEMVEAFADLVAQHWRRTGRNPSDEECDAMLAVARQLAESRATLQ